jgi:PKD repeat protein
MMLIDLNVGLLPGLSGVPENGMVKVEYSFENLHSVAAFDAYGWCSYSNNGHDMIAWTNRLAGGSGYSGITVTGTSLPVPVPLPGKTQIPTDPDTDGIYEDMNGNGIRDFNDLVLFFNQMEWMQANEPVGLFDFNGNGIIDFDDIVRLFREL